MMPNGKDHRVFAQDFVNSIEEDLKEIFDKRSKEVYFKLKKILDIYREEKISSYHFQESTGIGNDDISREKIDNIFAKLFLAEKSAVRMQFVSGTHAIACVLFGVLRPGDLMISLTGKPYDTLEEVIGLRGKSKGSLFDYGVKYEQYDISETIQKKEDLFRRLSKNNPKLVFIQKSCGYTWRKSLTNKQIGEICSVVHSIVPNCICFVDNCYGELVEESEPLVNGADIIAGSLIKNLGGTIVPTGGYIAGNSDLVDMACFRLTCPGIGSNGGINFGLGRLILQGLFLAPQMVNESLKGSDLVASVFKRIGFEVLPEPGAYRSDIIQAVKLKDPILVQKVCQSFQNSSPIDSFVNVLPSPMSGYNSDLVMSGGTFIEGSTSEFSADSPLREPYNLFVQGGSHISHIKIALIELISKLLEENLLKKDLLSSSI